MPFGLIKEELTRDIYYGLRFSHKVQFCIAILICLSCGATKKFNFFPVQYIAGKSNCVLPIKGKEVGVVNSYYREYLLGGSTNESSTTFVHGDYKYDIFKWTKEDMSCSEPEGYFIVGKTASRAGPLIAFGISKALMNFVTGVSADRFGRKPMEVVGWCIGLAMPIVAIFADNFTTFVSAYVLMGIQQGVCWSTSIFIMVDYATKKHSGFAIGLNETVGYTTLAIINVVAPLILDESRPRIPIFTVVFGIAFVNFIVSIVFLKESKNIIEAETDTPRNSKKEVTLVWPSGSPSYSTVPRAVCAYTTFVSPSLALVCLCGLMNNFVSAVVWSILKIIMKDSTAKGALFEPFTKQEIGNILLFYGLTKGTFQVVFGTLGDTYGRRKFMYGGLYTVALGLFCLALTTGYAENKSSAAIGFAVGSALAGIGTSVMYTNLLAAVCDFSEPSWRSSALGVYRFWRDLGYAVGAYLSGVLADNIGIYATFLVDATLIFLVATCVALFYEDPKKKISLSSHDDLSTPLVSREHEMSPGTLPEVSDEI